MREGKFKNFDFSMELDREDVTSDSEFTYAHFVFGRDSKDLKRGYATVGGIRFGNRLYYSVSLCSPKDNFSKKEGRYKVVENMIYDGNSHKRGVLLLKDDEIDKQPPLLLKKSLERFIEKTKNLPHWAHYTIDFKTQKKIVKKTENIVLEY